MTTELTTTVITASATDKFYGDVAITHLDVEVVQETENVSDELCNNTTIVPLDAKDQWRPMSNIRTKLFLIVREALNEDVMRDALGQLIRNHLPILGARIVQADQNGRLAYHIPKTFPDDSVLFQWSSETRDSSLEAAQILPTEPHLKGAAFFAPKSVPEMESNWIPPDWPVERRFEKPETLLLLVHITKYSDATVVALSLPHSVSDQMGLGSMLNAWLRLIAGQEPTPFLELAPGTLDGPKDVSPEEMRRNKGIRLTTKTELALTIMGVLPELLWNPKEIRRTLFLPEALVSTLRERHAETLRAKYGEDALALSNGDIITGILTKFAFLGRKSPKMVNLLSAINGRGRHPALPAGKPYLHNCVAYAHARIPIACSTPLSEVAYANHLAVREGCKTENIERDMAVTREISERGVLPHFGEPFEGIYLVSNWCAAWRDVDFGSAVCREQRVAGNAMPATIMPLVFGQSRVRNGAPARSVSFIMGKADGGYWCDFTATTYTMGLVEALLGSDPQLATL